MGFIKENLGFIFWPQYHKSTTDFKKPLENCEIILKYLCSKIQIVFVLKASAEKQSKDSEKVAGILHNKTYTDDGWWEVCC